MARFYFAPNGLIVANNASHDAPFSIEQNDGAIMLFAAKENCENEIYVPSYAVIDVKNTVRVYGSGATYRLAKRRVRRDYRAAKVL